MKKFSKKKRVFGSLAIVFTFILLLCSASYAFDVHIDDHSIRKGKTIQVPINFELDPNETLYEFQVYLQFDDDILEYVDGDVIDMLGDISNTDYSVEIEQPSDNELGVLNDVVAISGMMAAPDPTAINLLKGGASGLEGELVSLTFKALKKGTSKLEVDILDGNGLVEKGKVTVTVKTSSSSYTYTPFNYYNPYSPLSYLSYTPFYNLYQPFSLYQPTYHSFGYFYDPYSMFYSNYNFINFYNYFPWWIN